MRWFIILPVVLVVGFAGAAAAPYFQAYWKIGSRPDYRESPVVRGSIAQMVNSTGTVQPVRRVQVGSFVSGQIEKLYVNYNSVVKKGDLMAKIDPRISKGAVRRDQATCASARAEVARMKAELQEASHAERRAKNLRNTKKDYLSDAEMDRVKFRRLSVQAQLAAANAAVEQAEGQLQNSETNLSFTEIRAPVDGIVVDRKVDEGQTIASQFQTPELFAVAPEIDKHVYVFALIDEADIGLIRKAEREHRPVTFTVDAYPEDVFAGNVREVRINPTVTQNVVTYTVVVEAPNAEMKLLPGMTANLTFQVSLHNDVLRVPNTALRFYPQPDQVRREDRNLLEGGDEDAGGGPSERIGRNEGPATARGSLAGRDRRARYVWILDGDNLRAVQITVGISDKEYTEIVSGEIQEGQQVVTGVRIP